MKNVKKTDNKSTIYDDINPIENPVSAIDFYMPLPDEVYEKWKGNNRNNDKRG